MIDAMIAIACCNSRRRIMPLTHVHFTRGKLNATTRDIVSALRYAQAQSQAGVDGEAWGVNVASGVITIFRGASYAVRDSVYDQTVSFPMDTVVTGTAEYTFDEQSGRTTGGALLSTTSA